MNPTKEEGDEICAGVVRLLEAIRRRQLEQIKPDLEPIKPDPAHDALMRVLYPKEHQ